MAEILVKAMDATHSDPVKDLRGCYKRGNIVDVRKDGFEWGKEEGLPKFVKVKIPGLAVSTVKQFMDSEMGDGFIIPLETTIRRRKWNILVDDIPAQIKQTLQTTGEVAVTLTQIRNYIKNKQTGETY